MEERRPYDADLLNSLHTQAMEMVDSAIGASRIGDSDLEREYFLKAFDLESKAALLLATDFRAEPSRSVLFRSAAMLAIDAGLHREAERMAALGLSGTPSDSVTSELRELLERIQFERHLSLEGIKLMPNQIQVAIWEGSGVGPGIIESSELISRVRRLELIAQRQIARKSGLPFADRQPMPTEALRKFKTYVRAPRTGSFAFTLQLGAAPQLGLFDSNNILSEVVHMLDLYNQGKMKQLESLFESDDYYRNFIAQARTLAPDGKKIKQVGFTTRGRTTVRLKERPDLAPVPAIPDEYPESELGEQLLIRGVLLRANSNKKREIAIVNDTGSHRVMVPSWLMADVVSAYYEKPVIALVRKTPKKLELVEIEADDDSS